MDGREVLRVVAVLGVGLSVPGVTVAGGFGELISDSVVDGQVQGDGAVAAVEGLEVLHIITALVVCLTVPSIAVASGFGELVGDGVVDGQV